jgi:alginate O-acetyltransferase complex protein AlgI
MLFNSYAFLLGFLPATLLLYFWIGRWSPRWATALLAAASLAFYGWWDPRYLALLCGSMVFNFWSGSMLLRLSRRADAHRGPSLLLVLSVAANLALLGGFKYADFFLASTNALTGQSMPLLHIVLPLGISFFTFTQIAFLVDAAHGKVRALSPLNYGLFVSFFPHLIAGPILHHSEMMPQFERPAAARFNADNFALGLYLLCLGLAKKLGIADQFAPLADAGFSQWAQLDAQAAWATSIAYTIQLYFDFSGYTDMALGLGRMFNIELPHNFNSPYQATSIQDFWRRWHMTLSRFLRDYVYLPLGGSRGGRVKTLRNLFLTFLLGGLWHGAGWTFVVWGALHGAALAAQRRFTWAGFTLPRWLGWALTIAFVNLAWVYFRASSVEQANGIVARMLGVAGSTATVDLPALVGVAARQANGLFGSSTPSVGPILLVYAVTVAAVLLLPNTIALAARFRPSRLRSGFAGLLLAFALLAMHRTSEFIYFNF